MDFNNFVRLEGNLTHDPIFRTTGSGTAVINFRMATNDRRKNKSTGTFENIATYHNCTAWANQAEFIRDNFKLGDGIKVIGSIQHSEFEQNGVRRVTTTINVDEVGFGYSSRKKNSASDQPDGAEQQPQPGESYSPSQDDIDEANRLAADAAKVDTNQEAPA